MSQDISIRLKELILSEPIKAYTRKVMSLNKGVKSTGNSLTTLISTNISNNRIKNFKIYFTYLL